MNNAIKTRRHSLSTRMRLLLIFIILLLLASFLAAGYYVAENERRDRVISESEGVLNGIAEGIHSDFVKYREISRLIMIDDRLLKFLRAKGENVDSALTNSARSGIYDLLNPTTMVDSVFVFRNDGKYVATNRGKYMIDEARMSTAEWNEHLLEPMGSATYSLNGDNALFKINGEPIVSIGRAIYDISTQERVGILFMNISPQLLDTRLNAMTGSDIMICGTDGTYLAGDRGLEDYYDERYCSGSVLHTYMENGLYVSGRRVDDIPIVIINARYMENWSYSPQASFILVFLLAVIILAILVMGLFVTHNITVPVFKLTSAMEKNRDEGKLEKIDIRIPNNEIGILKDSYNSMVERVNELFEDLLEKEKTVQRAEMRVLHEQIKPHFLYNSLETIGFLAIDAGAKEVHEALETLGSFYRNFLSKGEREIPLKTEITIIKDYLALQKLRYGEILNDEYDIAEDTLNFHIPKLILQPIVENSIYHGIRLKGEPGTIRIRSRMKDGALHITVRDSGVGMTEDEIRRILDNRRNPDKSEASESFGLWGTIERIRVYCGSDDVVRIYSEVGEYTEIEFIIDRPEAHRQ